MLDQLIRAALNERAQQVKRAACGGDIFAWMQLKRKDGL